MELRIYDSQNIVGLDFGLWLVPLIKSKLIAEIAHYSFTRFDEYLSTSKSLTRLYSDQKYYTKDIIIFAANNITCSGGDGEITIRFNPTIFVPGFNRLALSNAVKLIDYGNLEIKGCPIFTNVFNQFSQEIDTYVSWYYNY